VSLEASSEVPKNDKFVAASEIKPSLKKFPKNKLSKSEGWIHT
jgi:hypothetical protein